MNHRNAQHKVDVMPWGTCVKIPYKGYFISLASDGGECQIETPDGLAAAGKTFINTSGESLQEAMQYIDSM